MITGVMAIHNEMLLLPYALNCLKDAPLDELVVVLDRCTDRSEEIIRMFKPKYPLKIYYKTWRNWQNPVAEVFEYGFSLAKGDILYGLSADCTYDKKTFDKKPFKNYALVSYRCDQRDLHTSFFRQNYEIFLRIIFQKLVAEVWRGFFATKKEVWQQLHFRDTKSEYGEHTQFVDYRNRLLEAGYKHFHDESTRNTHLRGAITKERQLREGKGRRTQGYPLWRVLLHSILHLKPYVLVGYLNA